MATKLEGGGKALVAGPLKNTDFFAASLNTTSFLALCYLRGLARGIFDRTPCFHVLFPAKFKFLLL